MNDVDNHQPRVQLNAPRNTPDQAHSSNQPHRTRRRRCPRARDGASASTPQIKFTNGEVGVKIPSDLMKFLQAHGDGLRDARKKLQRLYTLEKNSMIKMQKVGGMREFHVQRAAAESRYVQFLVKYQRATQRMNKGTEKYLLARFPSKKVKGGSDPSEAFLMGMYPKELE